MVEIIFSCWHQAIYLIYCFQRDTMPFDAGGDSRDVLIPNAKLLSYSDSESAHIGLTIAVDRCALRENRR